MGHAVVYLVPVGAKRFELYSEPLDESHGPVRRAGIWHRLSQRLHERWHDAVRAARRDQSSASLWLRMREWAVRRTAETIAEQRTLWTLRHCTRAALVHPSDLSASRAAEERDRVLAAARTHHVRWFVFDTVALVVSGLLALLPGPNLIAYYFLFRLIGHFLSWRGARQATRAAWDLRGEPALAELGRLAELPRDDRASRVDAIATGLNLPRLAAFFNRAAVPARS